jgi:carbon monoxide dehydrogenase subunit G
MLGPPRNCDHLAVASIRKEIHIHAPPGTVWDALRDVGALHTRLCPGFVKHTRFEGSSRVVSFGNGMTAREDIISVDDSRKRVAWAIVGQQFHHYQGTARVEPEGDGSLFIWTADLLPDELSVGVEQMMSTGIAIIRETLESG